MNRSPARNAAAPATATDAYAALYARFGWRVDEDFNIAEVCARRWARDPRGRQRTAILEHRPGRAPRRWSYAQLQRAADALSHRLQDLGVQAGDRVAIVLPQRFETAVAYMAVLQMGAVAMPLSVLFGPDALAYRLQDSQAVVAIADGRAMPQLLELRARCPALRVLVGVDGCGADLDWAVGQSGPAVDFAPVPSRAGDAAVLIYTSGTTGPPKGALIPHRALIGNLPGFVASQNWFGFDGRRNQGSQAVFWSPADWAWTGGLMDALLPTLYFGRPIVACAERFSADLAFGLMQQHRVSHTFLFPTALKAMMKAWPRPREHFQLQLQAIMSAGEAVGDAVFAYCRDELGVVVNEMFGQTEVNYIVGNCAMQWTPSADSAKRARAPAPGGWPARPGSMGRAYPGHRVAVIDEAGLECPPGVLGEVALHRRDVHGEPDPIFFLGYWRRDEATRAKFTGDWCRTGDLARQDADGYFWYEGRADDVFKSAGYRIGPGEVENCLVKHAAVANAAVVPRPDPARGALVKAYVVLSPDWAARRPADAQGRQAFDAQVQTLLQDHVRGLLAPYEYPKEVEFIDELPMTTTGKVQRRVLRLQEEERWRAASAKT